MNKILFSLILVFSTSQMLAQIDVDKEFQFAALQYQGMLKSHPDKTKFPQSTFPDGSRRDMPSNWWTPGFFPGSLWLIYEQTKDPKWKEAAHEWTMAIEREQHNTYTHDLGFMLYCSFGQGYRLTQNEVYKKILLTGAKSLATRFNQNVGLIKSWEKFQGKYTYPVIIDNMMNLEYLFWAAKQNNQTDFYNISVTHADNTIKNHFRSDYSSYHVVCYDDNGNVIARKTKQGASDESPWARGQSWGLYGYTVMYRETKDKKYFKLARNIANFIIEHPNLPEDKIPFWDYTKPGEERDASAAAITASALLELSQFSKGMNRKKYFYTAEKILQSLSSPAYKAALGTNNDFILMHCTGDKPDKCEIDVPLIYADYYYLEALSRYKDIVKN